MASVVSETDPDNIEQMKETKKEIEKKVAKILKLVRNNGQDKKGKIPEDSKKKSELIGLIEEFHKQYQSLYTQYEHIRGEMIKARDSNEKDSASSSDSEYYSPQDSMGNGYFMESHLKAADDTKEEHKTVNLAAGKWQNLVSKNVKKDVLDLDYLNSLSKTNKGETMGKDQKKKVDEASRERSALVKVHESHGSRASAQIKELEGQLTVMKNELETLCNQKKGLEVQLQNKVTEAKQLREKNVHLHAQISELELMSKEKGDEVSAILKKLKDNDSKTASRNKELMAQISNLQLEVDSLQQKQKQEGRKRNEASAQIKALRDKVNVMQHELNLLRSQKTDLELQVDMQIKEVTKNNTQIESLKDQLARKTSSENGLLKEREDLKLEVHSLYDQKTKLEELLRSKNQEKDQLREEKESVEAKACQNKYEGTENEASTKVISSLKEQINNLQQELDTMLNEKNKLETRNEILKQESWQSQAQVNDKILNLTRKIEDQETILKEQEITIKKFTEEQKILKHHSLDSPKYRSFDSPKYQSMDSSRMNHRYLEKKIEELAEKFHMKTENHIRLLLRRILVAEQIQVETKEVYKKVKEKLEQENKELSAKIETFEAANGNISNVLLEPGKKALTGLDLAFRKIDEENGNFLNRITWISNELKLAKNWITGRNDEMKKLQDKVDSLTAELSGSGDDRLIDMSQLEKKVENLEQQIREKDEVLLGLGEEKREAIRQLCILIDYHRNRYDDLKEVISKVNHVIVRRAA